LVLAVINEGAEIVLIFLINIYIVKTKEEPNLEERFEEKYREYKKRTPFLIPWKIINIIKNDKELSNRILTLEIMNNDLKLDSPFMTHPIICAFMILMCIPMFILLLFFSIPLYIFENNEDLIQKFPNLFYSILFSFFI